MNHKADALFVPLNIAVLTVSDTRTLETDTSGQLLVDRLSEAGHHLAARDAGHVGDDGLDLGNSVFLEKLLDGGTHDNLLPCVDAGARRVAEGGEQEDARVQIRPRDLQELHPHAHQRQVVARQLTR